MTLATFPPSEHATQILSELVFLQGFCTPADEVDSDETAKGTDFVDIEAGGFDQGQGESNVSDQVEPENIVSPLQGVQ